jgi:hypothetical protein
MMMRRRKREKMLGQLKASDAATGRALSLALLSEDQDKSFVWEVITVSG